MPRACWHADGSLFLNVGAKPTDPWTALDVAQAARPHLQLQNTIHWIKSIAIEKALAGTRAGLDRRPGRGHYKPINSRRFLHDCHEFVFHFTPGGDTPLDRQAVGVRYQDPSNIGRWRAAASGVRCRGNTWFIPYDTIQRPRERSAAPGNVSTDASRDVSPAARPRSHSNRGRPVPGPWLDGGRLRAAGPELHRHRDGRRLSRARRSSEPARRSSSLTPDRRVAHDDRMYAESWTSGSSKSSGPSPTPARLPPRARSFTSPSPRSAVRSCCSRTELGEPVFHRIGRRIRITPAGESLLQLSHRVFQDCRTPSRPSATRGNRCAERCGSSAG